MFGKSKVVSKNTMLCDTFSTLFKFTYILRLFKYSNVYPGVYSAPLARNVLGNVKVCYNLQETYIEPNAVLILTLITNIVTSYYFGALLIVIVKCVIRCEPYVVRDVLFATMYALI